MAFATFDSGQTVNTTLTNGNLTATSTGIGGVRAQGANRTGKWYFEMLLSTFASGSSAVTVAPGGNTAGAQSISIALRRTSGQVYINGTASALSVGATLASGDLICCALDLDSGLVWFRRGAAGLWLNASTATQDPATAQGGASLLTAGKGAAIDYYPGLSLSQASEAVTANFGATGFTGTPPTGFVGWTAGTQVDNIVASQFGRESWVTEVGKVAVTEIGRETWFVSQSTILASRVGRETWFENRAATKRPRRIMQVITSD